MPDLDVLRDLTPRFPPPGLDDLAAVVRRRRRRAGLTVGAGALAAVVLAIALGATPGSDRSTDPVDNPADDRTGEERAWTPDRIRAEGGTGGTVDLVGGRGGALAVRFWSVCERAGCDYATTGDDYDHRVVHSALEVTVDGYRTSGVFDLNGGPSAWPEIHLQPFDDDSIYVQDRSRQGGTQERYRLLDADGTTTDLTLLPSPAPAAPGPDVVRLSVVTGPGLARVDEAAGTIQPLDLPDAVHGWVESAADELLWGVADGCVVYWQRPGGDFAHRELGCRSDPPDLSTYEGPGSAAWFTADRMAVTEMGGSQGLPVALHVSLDAGATWRRIPVTEDTVDAVFAQLR